MFLYEVSFGFNKSITKILSINIINNVTHLDGKIKIQSIGNENSIFDRTQTG